ncbi:hypothetical protein FQA39_LY00715 [Lamprigera yunnana]|nr:hypothetical protein FQA39_LY00715 [Lamprigera yunnana]
MQRLSVEDLRLPENVLEKLRCFMCKEYLSQSPIYIYPNKNRVSCGRCPILFTEHPIRSVAYENLGDVLTFPCRYKIHGCLESICLSKMKEHENVCTYKQYFCPFTPLGCCPWQGICSEILGHYVECHGDFVLSLSTFDIDLTQNYDTNYILEHDENLFIAEIKCDTKLDVFMFALRAIKRKPSSKKSIFTITIEGIVFQKEILEFDFCRNPAKTLIGYVQLYNISHILEDPSCVTCCILPGSEDVVESEDVNSTLISQLECPVCGEYMKAPIFQCSAGHTICKYCKNEIARCPTCNENILDTRNFSLESMSEFAKFNCAYRKYGCLSRLRFHEINAHETACQAEFFTCPIVDSHECSWVGNMEALIEHTTSSHNKNVLNPSRIISALLNDSLENNIDTFLMKSRDSLFRLISKYEERCFQFTVQYMGAAKNSENYSYALDVLDNNGLNQRLYVARKCNSLLSYEDAFADVSTSVKIPLELLLPLLNQSKITYKCDIYKNKL